MPVVLRAPAWQRITAAAAMLALAVLCVGGGVDEGGWLLPAGLTAAAGAAYVAVRTWLLRVEAGSHDLLLVNLFRTVRVPWTAVARFGCDDDGLWMRLAVGGDIRVSAFQHGRTSLRFVRAPAEAAADRLERIRKQRRR